MIKKTINNNSNIPIVIELQDYMFTSTNIDRYTKHMIQITDSVYIKPKSSLKNIEQKIKTNNSPVIEDNIEKKIKTKTKTNNSPFIEKNIVNKCESKRKKESMYRPKQKDSLFWCFYILKHGFSNYEMEINNQYFVVEKNEKYKYIELLRKNKELLKIHKIKPLTELEDDLANKDKISIKTFFALCILENINVLLVSKRKFYELLCTDIDEKHPINIIHRNNESYEHSIELDVNEEIITKYRETFYKMSSFDATLKSMSSYKLDELIDLCKKLDINIEPKVNECNNKTEGKKKLTKKDIYELLVLKY
jgi:hypothetical protein